MIASERGHTGIVSIILKHTTKNINESFGFAHTALMLACMSGHIATTKLLLQNKANTEVANFFGATALMLACERGHTDIAAILLENGANVNSTTKVSK
jgi:ankyrin repeat protein